MENLKKLALAILFAISLYPVGWAHAASMPHPPPADALTFERTFFCPGSVILMREYNLFGDPQWIEARTFSVVRGEKKEHMLLYFQYEHSDGDGKADRVYVAIEGQAVVLLSYQELLATYPNLCDVVKPQA